MIGEAESFSKNNLQQIFIFIYFLLTRTQEDRGPGSALSYSRYFPLSVV